MSQAVETSHPGPAADRLRLQSEAGLRLSGNGDRRIAWRSWGQGDRHMVLLHGSAGSWTHFLRTIEPLTRQGWRVHAADLPGNGDSGPVSSPESFKTMAEQLAEGFDQIEPGQPRFVLLGFSFGSLVAEEWALLHPDRVEQLVLVRGSFDGSTPGPIEGMVKWKGLAGDEAEQAHRTNLAVLMFRDPARIDAAAVELHALNSSRTSLRPHLFEGTRTPESLARHSMPVTAISGEFDVLAGGHWQQQSEAFKAARPNDHHEVVRGAGHWVMYEAADAFNAALAAATNRH